jgi:hypothetical protein
MRRLVLFLVLVAAVAGLVTAQQPTPTAQPAADIRIGPATALSWIGDGEHLAVGVGQQLQLFRLNEPAFPHDLATLPVSGRPIALAANPTLLLAAVSRPAAADEILVIAPDAYRRGDWNIVNALQAPEAVQHLLVSPNGQWAAALNDDGYVLLRLNAPDLVESSALRRLPSAPVATALLDDALLLAQAETSRIDKLPVQLTHTPLVDAPVLTVEAPVLALATSADGTRAAAALANDDLVLFDPQTLAISGTFALEDGPAIALWMTQVEDRQILVVQIDSRSAVMLLDITDPSAVSLPGSAGLSTGSVITAGVAGARLALVGADGVTTFTLE